MDLAIDFIHDHTTVHSTIRFIVHIAVFMIHFMEEGLDMATQVSMATDGQGRIMHIIMVDIMDTIVAIMGMAMEITRVTPVEILLEEVEV